mmetsp:Transcript_31458/g.66603  ORF Transcript_31458/g.66603 Transcript_31458/m.66603 type:complete len:172 (-) Transcript_31458:1733-2248(-)
MNDGASTCTLAFGDLFLDGAEKNRWGANGMIFTTKALRDISVNWMQYHSWQGNVDQTVQVFTRSGDYTGYDTNGDGWNLIYDNMIVSNSPQYNTLVEFDTPVIIEATMEHNLSTYMRKIICYLTKERAKGLYFRTILNSNFTRAERNLICSVTSLKNRQCFKGEWDTTSFK